MQRHYRHRQPLPPPTDNPILYVKGALRRGVYIVHLYSSVLMPYSRRTEEILNMENKAEALAWHLERQMFATDARLVPFRVCHTFTILQGSVGTYMHGGTAPINHWLPDHPPKGD